MQASRFGLCAQDVVLKSSLLGKGRERETRGPSYHARWCLAEPRVGRWDTEPKREGRCNCNLLLALPLGDLEETHHVMLLSEG